MFKFTPIDSYIIKIENKSLSKQKTFIINHGFGRTFSSYPYDIESAKEHDYVIPRWYGKKNIEYYYLLFNAFAFLCDIIWIFYSFSYIRIICYYMFFLIEEVCQGKWWKIHLFTQVQLKTSHSFKS